MDTANQADRGPAGTGDEDQGNDRLSSRRAAKFLQGLDGVIDYVMIVTAPTPLSDELEVVVAWRGETGGAIETINVKLRG